MFFKCIQLLLFFVFLSPLLCVQEKKGNISSVQRPHQATKIIVNKSHRSLCLLLSSGEKKIYPIALGFNPIGHKEKQGDGKTPEGRYRISEKNPKSRFYKSLRISYPSPEDCQKCFKNGIKDPGDDIMIHGLGKFSFIGKYHVKKDWTRGCIAVTNEEMEEIYDLVKKGTPIEILP